MIIFAKTKNHHKSKNQIIMEEEVILKVVVTKDRLVAYGPGNETNYAVEQVAKVGGFPQKFFPTLWIKEIHKDRIVISDGVDGPEQVLTPHSSVMFDYEVEGREWSDGCVCDGTDYYAQIIWE